MTCTNCGAANEPGSEFCEACGIRLVGVKEDVSQPEVTTQSVVEPVSDPGENAAVNEKPAEPVMEVPASEQLEAAAAQETVVEAEKPETVPEPETAISEPAAAAVEQPPQPAPRMLKGAGVGVRFIATVIDIVVMSILISYITKPLPPLIVSIGNGMPLKGIAFWIALLIIFVYYLAMEAWLGGTAGKLLLGLKVVMQDGTKATFDAVAIRTFLRVIDALPIIVLYLGAAIFVWRSPINQRFGDRLARTLVVSQREFPGL